MPLDTVVAYTYAADIICPACAILAFTPGCFEPLPGVTAEQVLDAVAVNRGIDRTDEWTFDSDDFPKIVFADQVEPSERCGSCSEVLR
jgi:hypothetical protein